MQVGHAEGGKKSPSFPGKEEGGGHVDISLRRHQQWTSGTKQGLKLIPSSSHPSFYPHHTKHKEVRACSTNKCWGPTQRKYNEPYAVKADYQIANYFYERIAK